MRQENKRGEMCMDTSKLYTCSGALTSVYR